MKMDKRMGCRAKDIVTGIEGVIVAYDVWINGCVQYALQYDKDQEAKLLWVDDQQIEVLDQGIRERIGLEPARPVRAVGGARPEPTHPMSRSAGSQATGGRGDG